MALDFMDLTALVKLHDLTVMKKTYAVRVIHIWTIIELLQYCLYDVTVQQSSNSSHAVKMIVVQTFMFNLNDLTKILIVYINCLQTFLKKFSYFQRLKIITKLTKFVSFDNCV